MTPLAGIGIICFPIRPLVGDLAGDGDEHRPLGLLAGPGLLSGYAVEIVNRLVEVRGGNLVPLDPWFELATRVEHSPVDLAGTVLGDAAMKKKDPGILDESNRPATLYLDEIEQMVEILKESGEHLDIETADRIIEDVSELSTLPEGQLTSLTICAYNSLKGRTIQIQLASRIVITSTFSDVESFGVCTKLKEIVRKGRPSTLQRASASHFPIAFACALPALCFVLLLHGHDIAILICCGLWIAAMGMYLWAGTGRLTSPVIIILKRRKDSPGFWKRNWEDFAKTAVSHMIISILSGAVGLVFGYMLGILRPAVAPSGPQSTSTAASSPAIRTAEARGSH